MNRSATMGQRIAALRTQHHLSQEELAERLGVSRQSVSKWETDASVPDLSKLLTLSEVFGVTLDELGNGTPASPPPPAPEPPVPPPAAPASAPAASAGTQRVIGFILVGAGLLAGLLGLAVAPALLFLAAVLLISGIVCLAVRRHAGLVIGWPLFLLVWGLAPYVIGARAWAIFDPDSYMGLSHPAELLYLAIGWGTFAGFALLVFFTAKAVRAARRRRSAEKKP